MGFRAVARILEKGWLKDIRALVWGKSFSMAKEALASYTHSPEGFVVST